MADIKGIELSSEIYGLNDETARTRVQTAETQIETVADDVDTLSDKVGDLDDLETTAKTDLVSAINEFLTPKDVSSSVTLNSVFSGSPTKEVHVCGKMCMVNISGVLASTLSGSSLIASGLPTPMFKTGSSHRVGGSAVGAQGNQYSTVFQLSKSGDLRTTSTGSFAQGNTISPFFVYMTE